VVIWNPAVVMPVGVSRLVWSEAAQIRLGLHREHLGDRGRVVGEVEAVAGADLHDPAGQAGEEGAAVLEGALGVHGRADPGVDASEDGMSLAGGGRAGHAFASVWLAELPPRDYPATYSSCQAIT
jgi:hypothetical protein